MTYQPIILIDGQAPSSIHDLEKAVKALRLTHVLARDGETWSMAGWLNDKSVPVVRADKPSPVRIPWSDVESFGIDHCGAFRTDGHGSS